MARYIDENELLNAIDKRNGRLPLWLDEILMEDCKVADVAPVVHAHWIICSDGYYPYCSRCREEPTSREMTKFCDHCGAKMDEEGK